MDLTKLRLVIQGSGGRELNIAKIALPISLNLTSDFLLQTQLKWYFQLFK